MKKSGYVDWAYLAVSISITLVIWFTFISFTQEKNQLENINQHDEYVNQIQNRLERYNEILIGTKGLFAASEEITRDGWNEYVSAQKLEERFPGIQGTGYVKYIQGEQEYDKLNTILKERDTHDHQIKPEGIREKYFPVIFLHPEDFRNKRAIGYDIYSEENRVRAVDLAIKIRDTSITEKIILVQETEENVQNGFLMLMPIFSNENKSKILGLTYTVFRINDLMEGIFDEEIFQKRSIKIYDGVINDENIFFNSEITFPIEQKNKTEIYEKSFEFGGQIWNIIIEDTGKPFSQAELILAISIPIIGSILSMTVFFVLRLIGKNTIEKEIQNQKIKFDAMVSHELKTPLVPIKGYSEMLLEPGLIGELNIQQKDVTNKILENTSHLESLIEKILLVQRYEMGRYNWKIEKIMLHELMNNIHESNSFLMNEKNIRFNNNISENIEISTSINDVKEVFINIIQNAVDFVPSSGGRIQIDAKIRSTDILFSIKNNGPEIPKEELTMLFAKYYQIDTSLTRKHGGTGLGLVICKNIIDGLGGKIWAQSEVGKDVVFYFTILKDASKYVDQKSKLELGSIS